MPLSGMAAPPGSDVRDEFPGVAVIGARVEVDLGVGQVGWN
jgi:hypothetical protein